MGKWEMNAGRRQPKMAFLDIPLVASSNTGQRSFFEKMLGCEKTAGHVAVIIRRRPDLLGAPSDFKRKEDAPCRLPLAVRCKA
ncbi:hypothetical protein B1690_12740 [Geobacillus sp. 46C-IIa]|nr:hypothetical protein B1690_12740 [Geobacillus sp. 46C-IIa]